MLYSAGFSIAGLALYTLVMLSVGNYDHRIGLIGGFLTIAGILVAACWYNHRQGRNGIEIMSPQTLDATDIDRCADRQMASTLIERREVEFPPNDRQFDREKRHEPIFGTGATPFLAQLIVSVGALGLLLLVLLLADGVKEKISGLLFGGSHRSQPLKPGESTTIDGYKFKRID